MSRDFPYYQRKLYAFLRTAECPLEDLKSSPLNGLLDTDSLELWWTNHGTLIQSIAKSSDRVGLPEHPANPGEAITTRHLISGQSQTLNGTSTAIDWTAFLAKLPSDLIEPSSNANLQKIFLWLWRFYPAELVQTHPKTPVLLHPADRTIPDCPFHSYVSTVSALTGARYPKNSNQGEPKTAHPYLLVFTFSPIQDFIKASRKFLDFWSGSYLLHYLSARLCWEIAKVYGPDALIVPSLWGQDIIDAFLVNPSPNEDNHPLSSEDLVKWFSGYFSDHKTPAARFEEKSSNSLSTAGFPNVITALVPGKEAAEELGEKLSQDLTKIWHSIGIKVRDHIRKTSSERAQEICKLLEKSENKRKILCEKLGLEIAETEPISPYLYDLKKWAGLTENQPGNLNPSWEWDNLWDAQLSHTWEPYWTVVPLGDPEQPLILERQSDDNFNGDWITAQSDLSQAFQTIPSEAEKAAFDQLNVGTWWGSFQQRLRLCLMAIKNTRSWNIPAAPGERSTISGQFSAVHPNFNYSQVTRHGKNVDFREGAGIPASSMGLFWSLMANSYPGLFSGSEHLNALELTKRLSWIYGDIAQGLGISIQEIVIRIQKHKGLLKQIEVNQVQRLLYERFVQFPNLTSIAASRFSHDNPEQVKAYSSHLGEAIQKELGRKYGQIFRRIVRIRPSNIAKTDRRINANKCKSGYLNGVMFSGKWLSEDLGCDPEQVLVLRSLVDKSHQEAGFRGGSPSDWWAVVLADGDGMGQYISGSKLENYNQYLVDSLINKPPGYDELAKTQKRMGPATHIGLNRALLDFSNRLVPYLTEGRFCGKTIYSGGDDVMAVLPLEDLPEYVRSLRAAWCGGPDPKLDSDFESRGGYWHPKADKIQELKQFGIENRPHFTMGNTATMSMGIVIAYKTVPLPTVLESLWEAEKDRAKKIPDKDGLCFRVIYGGGNTLEALMKGSLLNRWWECVKTFAEYGDDLSPLLYRLSEELPKRAMISKKHWLFPKAAKVIMSRRDDNKQQDNFPQIIRLTRGWECWVKWTYRKRWGPNWIDEFSGLIKQHGKDNQDQEEPEKLPLGTKPEDLGQLLRFTAFWVDKMVQRQQWSDQWQKRQKEGGNK